MTGKYPDPRLKWLKEFFGIFFLIFLHFPISFYHPISLPLPYSCIYFHFFFCPFTLSSSELRYLCNCRQTLALFLSCVRLTASSSSSSLQPSSTAYCFFVFLFLLFLPIKNFQPQQISLSVMRFFCCVVLHKEFPATRRIPFTMLSSN